MKSIFVDWKIEHYNLHCYNGCRNFKKLFWSFFPFKWSKYYSTKAYFKEKEKGKKNNFSPTLSSLYF